MRRGPSGRLDGRLFISLLGRAMVQFAPSRYRFWSVQGFPYLLVYDAEASPPRILRVVHMARDLEVVLSGLAEEA